MNTKLYLLKATLDDNGYTIKMQSTAIQVKYSIITNPEYVITFPLKVNGRWLSY